MNTKLEIFCQGIGRVMLCGVHPASNEEQSIRAWIKTRIDFIRIEEKPISATWLIHYDDKKNLSGSFIRALKDQLYVIRQNQKKIDSFQVFCVHKLQGRIRLKLQGVSSKQILICVKRVTSLNGVQKVKYYSGSDTILVFYDSIKIHEKFIINFLKNTDFNSDLEDELKSKQIRWGGAFNSTFVLTMCLSRMFPFQMMATSIALVTLGPLRRSLQVLMDEGQLSIDALDVAATFTALITGRPITAAFVIWMEGVGNLLLDLSAHSARRALSQVMQHQDKEVCRLLLDGTIERVALDQLQVGDQFLVQTGQSIVADGRVIRGRAEVDEKVLTGESHLLHKCENDRVLAATIVVAGQIVVEVEVLGKNTEAAKIEQVLSTVGSKPLTLQRDALAFGGKLVPPTFGIAGVSATLASNLNPAVCVLVTDFGTGIRISVPTSALTALTIAARGNILVKGAQYLERLSKTDVIIFDKTGTLTLGVPEVVEAVTYEGSDVSRLIQLSASVEIRQEHPVAKALISYAKKIKVNLIEPDWDSEEYAVGLGLSAKVDGQRVHVGRSSWLESQNINIDYFKNDLIRLQNEQVSTLCVAVDGQMIGVVGYSDSIRPESREIIQQLRSNGRRKILLLSGDSSEVVQKVARELEIDEAVGALLPDQKAEYVRNLKAAGHVVAMVGDGINDTPALALADVGVSISGSTEVALETADVILLEGGLLKLPKAFAMSDQAMLRVKQNLGVIIVPNGVAICLGAVGLLSPPMAAIVNNGATIAAVIAGTLPLLWTRDERKKAQPEFQLKTEKMQKMKTQYIPNRNYHKPRQMRVVPLPTDAGPKEQGTFVRFEEKFFLPKQNSLAFKTAILEHLSLSSPVPGTKFTGIESVYFDSPDFQIYQMHFAARQEERFKIRARSYAPNGVPGDGSAHLEYKSKHAGVSKKTRFQIGPEELKLLWEGYTIPDDSKNLEVRNPELEENKLEERVRHINTLISGIHLKPSCIVRYRREAFEGENLRLTIDDQIAFETTRNFSGMRPMLDANPDLNAAAIRMRTAFQHGEYLLVEVKHPGTVPGWLTELLNANHCQKAKFSKYCYSVTEALLA